MTPERYEQIRAIFVEVCDLDPLRRSAVLDERCAADPELRSEVDSLLSHEQSDDSMGISRLDLLGRMLDRVGVGAQPPLPQTFGQYRLTKMIGEGGMGSVFEAEQENPRRTVAVKVLKPGAMSPSMLRRFAQEAHVLARLQHPGIAQVFDAGAVQGAIGQQPYFTMEFIRGERLLEYARKRGLNLRGRLELMARIADAVHHAHTKGIIHRDLKPGNILVVDDERSDRDSSRAPDVGQPKILDFGVARALDAELQPTALTTHAGQLIGTVPYMSPEQAAGDPNEIDTRSDVYALGVICFELLTNQHPHGLEQARLHEAVRIIRQETPRKLGALDRHLRGDVETMVAKALEREKSQRYQSAADFSADLRRYLNDEPIMARPASARYHLRQFAKRHKTVVGASIGIMLALTAGVITTSYWALEAIDQRDRTQDALSLADDRLKESNKSLAKAQEEEQKAKAVIAFFQRMLAGASPNVAMGRDMSVRELLDEASAGAILELQDRPELRAAVELAAGIAYLELAALEEAERLLQSAVATRAELYGADHAHTLEAMIPLADVFSNNSDYEKALELTSDIYRRARQALGPEHELALRAGNSHGLNLRMLGQWDEAEQALTENLAIAERSRGPQDENSLTLTNSLALLYSDRGDLDRAGLMFEKVVQLSQEVKGHNHPHTISSLNALALNQQQLGRHADSLATFQRALESAIEVLGERHPDSLLTMQNMSVALASVGQLDDAEAMLRQALAGSMAAFGERHRLTLSCLTNLTQLLIRRGRYGEAEETGNRMVDLARELIGSSHPEMGQHLLMLANAQSAQGKRQQAIELYREALELQRTNAGADHPSVLVTMNNLGQLLSQTGEHDQAIEMLTVVLNARIALLGPEHPQTLTTQNNLGLALRGSKRLDEAERLFQETLLARQRVLSPDHPDTLTSIGNLAGIASDRGDLAAAEKLFLDLAERRARVLGASHPQVAQAFRNLAWTIHKQKRAAEALPYFKKVAEIRLESLGGSHQDTIDAFRDLASVHHGLLEFDLALAALDQAIEGAKAVQADGGRQINTLGALRAVCLARAKRYEEAAPALVEAHRLLAADFGPQHAQTQAIVQVLVEVYESIGSVEKAAEYRALWRDPNESAGK